MNNTLNNLKELLKLIKISKEGASISFYQFEHDNHSNVCSICKKSAAGWIGNEEKGILLCKKHQTEISESLMETEKVKKEWGH